MNRNGVKIHIIMYIAAYFTMEQNRFQRAATFLSQTTFSLQNKSAKVISSKLFFCANLFYSCPSFRSHPLLHFRTTIRSYSKHHRTSVLFPCIYHRKEQYLRWHRERHLWINTDFTEDWWRLIKGNLNIRLKNLTVTLK